MDPMRSFQGRAVGGVSEKLSVAGVPFCGNTGLQSAFIGLVPLPGEHTCVFGVT